jgi:hypothetical protein
MSLHCTVDENGVPPESTPSSVIVPPPVAVIVKWELLLSTPPDGTPSAEQGVAQDSAQKAV